MYNLYLITNHINQKQYVGITKKSVEERWIDHIQTATKKKKKYALHKAINKYGSENFTISFLESTDDPTRECYWIDKYNTFTEGYNLTKGGDGTIGIVFSEEEKKNRSIRAKKDHKLKKIGMYGKTHTEETKSKMKCSHKRPWLGKSHSEETKKKIAESVRRAKSKKLGMA